MDDVQEYDPQLIAELQAEFAGQPLAPEEAPERFVILLDVREEQDPERLAPDQDGQMDYPFLSLFGKNEGLIVDFVPGMKTAGTNEEGHMLFSRELLKAHWPTLTHHVYTGEWSPKVAGDLIHLQLDPFQRELLLRSLHEYKLLQHQRARRFGLHTDEMSTAFVTDAQGCMRDIEALELAIELAGVPAQEAGDLLS